MSTVHVIPADILPGLGYVTCFINVFSLERRCDNGSSYQEQTTTDQLGGRADGVSGPE